MANIDGLMDRITKETLSKGIEMDTDSGNQKMEKNNIKGTIYLTESMATEYMIGETDLCIKGIIFKILEQGMENFIEMEILFMKVHGKMDNK